MAEAILKVTRLEFRKLSASSAFWILLILHTGVLFIVTFNIQGLLSNANIAINNIPQLDLSLAPIFQFPDIWQNVTYIAGYFKIILALIIIISVCNEFSMSTARQNIVNGLSRKEWVLSKLFISAILAVYSTLLVISICLLLGLNASEQVTTSALFKSTDFVLAYTVELCVYFIYALFLALLVRRSGIALILLLVYDFIIEPVLGWSIPDAVYRFMPMNTLDNLNTFPFTKYVGSEVSSVVSFEQLVWAISYGIAFSVFSYFIFKRQDL
jgi:hypothetical protein